MNENDAKGSVGITNENEKECDTNKEIHKKTRKKEIKNI